jgi:hypothetical protein
MSRRRPTARVLAVVTAALLVAGLAGRGAARADGTDGRVAGAALTDLGSADASQAAAAVARLRADGLNTVALNVWWQTDSPTASSLHPYSGTVDDTTLSAQMAVAEAAGLHVVVVPLFYCTGCEGGSRSVVHPADVAGFFASYRAFVDRYAALAQAGGATTLYVGSELSSLEGATAEWRSVIAGARALFHGQIAYEENWDVLGNARFLDAVDLIGVSAYFPLDPAASPSLAQLLADWHSSTVPGWQGRDWVAAVARLAATYRKPVVFGEVGYMSGDHAAARPYLDWYDTPNPTLQADLYQALLETFGGYQWWAGAVWWDYELEPDSVAANGRTFAGKPAETVLQLWYAGGVRPPSPTTPMA